jgi:multicomponent Na+:H+ antiporter subunit A
VAGNVDHETGTRDVTLLGGLRRLMPFTALAGLLAALSKAGAPPMFGFIGKELLYKTKISIDSVGAYLVVLAVIANVALVASALVVSVRPFFGQPRKTPKKAIEAPFSMILGPLVLALLGLGRGLQPEPFETNLGSAAATAIMGRTVEMKLKLWHGVDATALAVMGLSLLTLAAGFGVYKLVRIHLVSIGATMHRLERFGPGRAYETGLAGLYGVAGRLTRLIQTGYLRHYVMVTVFFALFVIAVPLLRALPFTIDIAEGSWRVHEVLIVLLLLAAAVFAALSRSRLTAVAALGVTGVAVALLFMLFSAPDLSMTQIVVETLTVILLALIFCHLPPVARRSKTAGRVRDMVVAAGLGAVMALLVLAAAAVQPGRDLSDYFLAESGPAAFGRNVVNVILVDFRALDTLGEISVLAAAGLGVFVLLRVSAATRRKEDT